MHKSLFLLYNLLEEGSPVLPVPGLEAAESVQVHANVTALNLTKSSGALKKKEETQTALTAATPPLVVKVKLSKMERHKARRKRIKLRKKWMLKKKRQNRAKLRLRRLRKKSISFLSKFNLYNYFLPLKAKASKVNLIKNTAAAVGVVEKKEDALDCAAIFGSGLALSAPATSVVVEKVEGPLNLVVETDIVNPNPIVTAPEIVGTTLCPEEAFGTSSKLAPVALITVQSASEAQKDVTPGPKTRPRSLSAAKKIWTHKIIIKVTSNNIFCTLTGAGVLADRVMQSASAGQYKVKITKKRLKRQYKPFLIKFFAKIWPELGFGGLMIFITAPVRLRKKIILLLLKLRSYRLKSKKKCGRRAIFIKVQRKKCFNGCQSAKRRRKKRKGIRLAK